MSDTSAFPPSTAHDAETPANERVIERVNEPVEIGSALERVMARFAPLARRLARTRGVALTDVDEVLQDVRIRLWKAHPSGETISALPASYLVKVVTSVIIDRIRRRRAHVSLSDLDTAASMPTALQVAPADGIEAELLGRRVAQALATLPVNRRLAVQLHLEGYERHEIVRMTGWTEAKTRNLVYRGLDDLRQALGASQEGAS